MSNKAPSFFKLATQPKWIGALLLALLVAAIFAALGQWQLDRTFTKDDPKTNTSNSSLALVPRMKTRSAPRSRLAG
jgi:cytochrome oxidase assembly protein ShyY1